MGGRGRGGKDKEEWIPCTKLGRLVKDGKIKSLEQIFLFSIPIKEFQIVDMMLGDKLKDEAMQIMPVQKQTSAGQRTRFRAFIAVGDYDGLIGLGVKCSKEVAGAIAGGIITAKCGSVRIRLVPAARGTGIVASPTSKKILQMA